MNETRRCDLLMKILGPIAVAGGCHKAVVHGDHDDDISMSNLLFAASSREKFSDAHSELVLEAFKNGVYGAVEMIEIDEENSTFEDLNNFYYTPVTHPYRKEGNTLVSAR